MPKSCPDPPLRRSLPGPPLSRSEPDWANNLSLPRATAEPVIARATAEPVLARAGDDHLPGGSVARTWQVCGPLESVAVVCGDEQDAKARRR